MDMAIKKIILILPVFIFLVGCATTSLSTLQRRSIEAKELVGNFDDAFKATLQVLQDYGYVIKTSDYQAGVIQGETGAKFNFWWGAEKRAVTTIVEQFGENRVKERITFVLKLGSYGELRSKIIEDPKFLQEIYDAIQKEIFVRQQLDK
jgi:hypothetical protein